MAPAISYSSFHVASGPRFNHGAYARRKSTLVVYARQNPFGFGKAKDESSGEDSPSTNTFFIDFSKLPDPKSLVPVVNSSSGSPFLSRRKDPGTVFVAGATGQAGIRIAQTLLRKGFAVRAGVPDLAAAQELARLAATYKIISSAESKRLNAVESAFLGGPEAIAKAIGPAGKVVVTIGPAENGPSAEVTTNDALEVIRAAQLAKVGHVAVLYDLGTSGTSTYNVLDGITSFFSNLFSRSRRLTLTEFLDKVVETDVSYTLIKANLTDDYAEKSSYSIVVSKEGDKSGTSSEFKVLRSQIASLVADVFSNISVTENKVVEVSTSPSATSKPIAELFSAIPEDGRRRAYVEAKAKTEAEEEAVTASQRALEEEQAAKKPLQEDTKAASFAKAAKETAEAVGPTLDGFLSKAKDFGGELSWEKLNSQFATAVSQNQKEEPKSQIAVIRGQAKARKLPPQRALLKQLKAKPKPDDSEKKAEVRNVFGGLFKQETIYIDDD